MDAFIVGLIVGFLSAVVVFLVFMAGVKIGCDH
jgi:hypothetical protein